MAYIFRSVLVLRKCANVKDFNNEILFLTAKLLKKSHRHNKIRKAFLYSTRDTQS